jgi:ABC-type multidrug transport system ATPase subunit/predicted component of type VI protein secretion system
MSQTPTYKLVFKFGAAPAQVFELTQPIVTIGRDAANTIVIQSAGVSRAHAQLTRQGGGFAVQDLGSSNGTFVNGQQISAPRPLAAGDKVRLGQLVELVYEVDIPAPPAPSPDPRAKVARVLPSDLPPARPAPPPDAPVAEGATVLGEALIMPAAEPPQLLVEEAGSVSHSYTLAATVYTLGRAEDNTIHVASKLVSRHHARLEMTDEGYRIVPLPDVGNPLYLQGKPLAAPYVLKHGDLLRIGGRDPGTMVTLRYHSPSTAVQPLSALDVTFGERTQLTIGRDASNDIRLDVPQVSRYHAQLERVGARYRVRDLRSANGTFVNDQRVEGEIWLKPDDQLRIGPYRFVMGDGRFAQYDESSGVKVEVVGLNKWVRKDLNILQNISMVAQPREFIVVVGQSGGGKSTLVDAIAGYRPATHGQVFVNGTDVYRNFDAIRNDIGFVPQRDIIHMELTVYQALDYAAQLRMPPDTTADERRKRVLEVLDDLDLTHRKDVQISGLSGGQQKRVSIGVELLTKPGLFFLDEPTSGLDPGTETALMQLMRRLADQGRTIILITHATKNVMLADKVVFLARGGYVGWFGPPDEALRYFDQYRSERDRRANEMEFDQIYAILDDPAKGSAADWAKRFQGSPAYQKYVAAPLHSKGQILGGTATAVNARRPASRRQISSLRQLLVLSARNIKILTRDRFSLILMLAAAPLVGMLDVVIALLLGREPFSPTKGSIANVIITLFLLAIYAIMVGALGQMREIVKEQDIYKRERLVNLKIIPYVLSKVWVAALLALYQAGAYIIVRYIAFKMPGGFVEFALLYITLALATMAGMMLGLFASALAPNANSAPMIVILFVLPQIVLGGALLPMPGTGQLVSAFFSSRWAFENFMAITGVGSDVAGDACWALPPEQRAALSLDYRNANCKCMGVNLFNSNSCLFPAAQTNYDPTIDQTPPVAPDPIGDPPPKPVLPPQPPEPVNPDSVAIANYFQDFKVWKANAESIQADYEARLAAYQAQAAIYQTEVVAYQQALAEYQIPRNAAIGKSEGLVKKIQEDMGWTFVDKHDLVASAIKVGGGWAAQSFIIGLLFVGIVILQKRKDAA